MTYRSGLGDEDNISRNSPRITNTAISAPTHITKPPSIAQILSNPPAKLDAETAVTVQRSDLGGEAIIDRNNPKMKKPAMRADSNIPLL
jgi:hypothetical protein